MTMIHAETHRVNLLFLLRMRLYANRKIRKIYHSSLTGLLISSITAVAVNPRAQMNSSTVEPKDCRTAPAMTEAIGIMPWELTLVMLLTLLSLSLSTIRMMAVLTGILMAESRTPVRKLPAQKITRKAFRLFPRSTCSQ